MPNDPQHHHNKTAMGYWHCVECVAIVQELNLEGVQIQYSLGICKCYALSCKKEIIPMLHPIITSNNGLAWKLRTLLQ